MSETDNKVAASFEKYKLTTKPQLAYEIGFSHAGGGIPCRPHPAATQLVFLQLGKIIYDVYFELI